MSLENKIISREIGDILYASGLTVGTAESCTGGRVGEGIIAIPGASNYFKGGIICYADEIKENILKVNPSTIEEHTVFSEEVAREMVVGAINALNVNYAIAVTGVAGPGGALPGIPVGTIWIACGTADDIVTMRLTEDFGRDINLAIATSKALKLFLDFLRERDRE
ncbi:MAG: CinA family protein [Prevotella sp.]|nr:CinA family protein [Prevotella sp.]